MTSSLDRLRSATEAGILSPDSIRATLGQLGLSASDELLSADTPMQTPDVQDTRSELSDCFATAKQLYGIAGIEVPTVNGFDNIDQYLARFARQQAAGLEPAFVLAPDLSYTEARDLFHELSTRHSDVLINIHVNGWTEHESSGLLINPAFASTESWDEAIYYHAAQPSFTSRWHDWTLSIIPTAQLPPTNLSPKELTEVKARLPTLPQLIALHMERIFNNKPMIDTGKKNIALAATDPSLTDTLTVRYVPASKEIAIGKIANNMTLSRAVVRWPEWF